MVKRIIGYLLSIIGILGLAISNIPKIKEALQLSLPLEGKSLLIASIILIIFGVIFIATGKNKNYPLKGEDIPVRKNGKIIEYRRE